MNLNPKCPTLAVYAIPDRTETKFPAYVHDHNLCLMHKGKILKYLQLERLTRRKYDNRLHLFIEDIIDEFLPELKNEDFDLVSVNSFVGQSWASRNGRLRFEAQTPIESNVAQLQKGRAYFQTETWKGRELSAYGVSHELAHIFSALPFFPNLPHNTLMVHFDGGASTGNFSAFHYKNGALNLLENHWDLSFASKWFNDNALHFQILNATEGEHTSVPGKLMGYAAYGTYRPELVEWLKANGHFKEVWHDLTPFFAAARQDFVQTFNELDTREPFLQDIAATIQGMFQAIVLHEIGRLKKQSGAQNLYYAGGCALNIVANSQIVFQNWFDQVCIPPCCNDSGLSIGAAAFVEWRKHGRVEAHSPYLNNFSLKETDRPPLPKTVAEIARLISEGAIIGVCNGAGEAGPRALGNRSLLARADDLELSRKISQKCKGREWYRPVAPVMLLDEAQKVTNQPINHSLSRFMLLDFPILPEFREKLAGVTHVNGTARIQTIQNREENPFLFDLLTELRNVYQIHALINTSFNAAGEPIVHTPEDALKSAQTMNLNALVINQKLQILKP